MQKQLKQSYALPSAAILILTLGVFILVKLSTVTDSNSHKNTYWIEVSKMQYARRALAAVEYNGYLYALGGVDDNGHYVQEVEYAKILPDGKLGVWRKTSPLNHGRFYLAAAAVSGYIYAIGGGSGPLGDNNQPSPVVEKARVMTDGRLGPWELTSPMTTPRRGLKVVTHKNTIYALGGYNGIFLKSIERAGPNVFGEIDAWIAESKHAVVDRYIHSAAVSDEYIYLLGGHVRGQNKLSYGDVEKAFIKNDASLSDWTIEQTRLLMPRFIASSLVLNNYLYLFAGHDGGSRIRHVEFSPISGSGELGRWKQTTALLHRRSAAAVAAYDKYVYLLGGMGESGVLNNVEMAAQFDDGHLGQH